MNAESAGGDSRLSRFSLDRRITVLVLLLTTLVVGTVASLRIPVELIPTGFTPPFLSVRVPWPDAPPREVLDKLSLPLEEELSTVRGIDRVVSVAVSGRATAYMRFKHGTDMDIAYREVRDRVERARNRFPDDVDRVFIHKEDASGIPVYMLGIAVDPSVVDSYDLIQNEVILPLSRIDGVATVSADGLIEKEILIELDRDRTAAAGLNIWDLAQQLSGDNFTLASGNVRDGSRKLLLRSVGRFDSLEQLAARPLGPRVRLGDVATITYDQPEYNFRVRAMSKPAVAVMVLKEGEANIREVSREVGAVVERLKLNPRLSGLEMMTLFSQGDVIDEALSTLVNSGLIGGLIAGAVLFLFLRRVRLTVIIALAIPLSSLIGLTVMYFTGESLNLLTLLGLMLCVGMLVDNSVVVAENIIRLVRGGMEPRQACIRGASEVGLAITMSTLTTIVVFLPVSLVDGPGQFFLLRLAVPVCVSVAASLLVALIFVPLSVYLTLGPVHELAQERRGWFAKLREWSLRQLGSVYDQSFGRLNDGYSRMLGFFLRRRLDLVMSLIVVFALTAIPMQKVKVAEVQEEERSGFYIGVEMPGNTTLEEAEEWFLEAEKIVESKKEELGLEGWFLFHRKVFGEMQGWFTRPRTKEVTSKEATKIVLDALPKRPGMKLTVGEDRETDDSKDESEYTLVIHGEETDQLETVGNDLEATLARVDGVLGIKGSGEQAPNELALVIDRERAQLLGVNPTVVAGVVGYALRGTPLPKYRDGGKEVPVRVRYREADRESLSDLADFPVPSAGGVLPLSAVTSERILPSAYAIVREDKRISRAVTLVLDTGRERETRERLDRIVAGIDLPEGVSFGASARGQTLDEDVAGLRVALVLSVIFIYLLMGFLFESFILPLSIILTIPLSAIGVWWLHFLTGYNLDVLGIVAIVLLVGVVVNNGIVLIDYVNRLRAQGIPREEALSQATHRRFRPIMMTAITTIGGMVPLAFAGANSIGLSYTSFSLTLIGGMTTATLLTLLVVPIFYTFFDDAREAGSARVRRLLGQPTTPPGEATDAA